MRHTLAQLVLLTAFLVCTAPAFSQPYTGERQTYLIELRAGANLVALPVVPDDPAVTAVVGNIVSQLSLVQDDKGHYMIPDLGIDAIGAWQWSEAYKVHTKAATSLLVQGPEITPELSPLPLEAGANWIPYLRNEALPVEEGLATILPSLSRVEDNAGLVFEPGSQNSTLDSLRVGHGYRVWLTQQDTLIYPVNQDVGGGNGLQVGTMDQALALRGLEPGQEVDVLGYYVPGDGGGGRFRVENSGAPTDGGLVFVPDEHQSSPVTEVINNNSIHPKPFSLPGNSKLVYGTLTVDLFHPNSNTELATINARYLHGHEYVSKLAATPLIDYAAGALDDTHNRLLNWCEEAIGLRWQCDLRATYRRTTSRIRLHRVNVGETLNANWFGARPISIDPDFDNQPVLAHVINVANAMNADAPGSITTVLLPSRDVYEYFGSIQLGDGLTLKGAGGTELVTHTNDLGHTYQPVRLKSSRTTLRVKADEALTHVRMDKNPSDPGYVEPDVKHWLGGRQSTINPAPRVMQVGLEDIVLDGNWEGNQQAWTEGWMTFNEMELYMRNTPSWSAFVSTNHQGVPIPLGQELRLRNVGIRGYGGAALLGHVDNVWNVENVRVSDTVWNHHIYGTNGDWTNLTLAGFSWGHAAWYVGEISNLVIEDIVPNPRRFSPEAFAIRGADAYSEADIANNPDDPRLAPYLQSDGEPIELGTTIDGFYVDLRGSGLSVPFGGIGPKLRLRNGKVIMDASVRTGAVFTEFANGSQEALYPEYNFDNITVYTNGEGSERLFGRLNITGSSFRNITTNSTLLDAQEKINHLLSLRAHNRNHYAWNTPQTVTFSELKGDAPSVFMAEVDIHSEAAGADYFVLDSHFNNTSVSNTLFRNSKANGLLRDLSGDPSKLRVFMDGVAFNMYGNSFDNLEIFFAVGRMQNCTDARSGHTSEDGSTFSYTANGGETELDLPTNLLWTPLRQNYTSVTEGEGANGLFDSFEYRASDGSELGEDKRGPEIRINLTRALNPGEQVTFTWEAAVRPWESGIGRPASSSYGSNNPLTRENGR
ncbi:MAG: hypothetical protein AAGF99_00015 [Bacteroidota bacterium]